MDIELYAKDPLTYGHKPQNDFFEYARKRKERFDGSIDFMAFVAGRGSGKTAIAVIDLFFVAMIEAPKAETLWTTRTNGEIDKVLISCLKALVPSKFYRICNQPGNRYIQWSRGHKTHLVSRQVYNSNMRPALGMTVMGVYFDELATNYDHSKVTDILNTVRGKQWPFLFCVSISTPLPNGFKQFVQRDDCYTVYSSSYDSPFLDNANVQSMADQLDEDTVKQELMGQFVVTSGRMWDTFVEKPFPEGNILENFEFDHSKPFYLGVDLGGSQSAIGLYQYTDPIHPETGHKLFNGRLMVLVAEWLPNKTGIEVVIQDIVDRYCGGDHNTRKPALVCIGHDVNSSTVTGATGAEVFRSLGWQFDFPRGQASRKAVQRQQARSMILNSRGERRFVISATKDKHGTYQTVKHMGKNQTRGLLDVMRLDTYPDNDEVFNKDKAKLKTGALEDARDAWLYPLIINHPPTLNASTLMIT